MYDPINLAANVCPGLVIDNQGDVFLLVEPLGRDGSGAVTWAVDVHGGPYDHGAGTRVLSVLPGEDGPFWTPF
jgi:hypothetical protein